MTIEDVEQLIARGENRHTELKKSTGELTDAMHTACAFLNGEGGWLLFGITPNTLRTLGQTVSDSTRREIAQALSGLEPTVDVQVQYVDVPEPIWSVDGGYVCITFKRPSTGADNNLSGELKDPSRTPVGPQSGPQLDSSRIQVGPKYEPSTSQVQAKYKPSADAHMFHVRRLYVYK